MAAAQGDSEAQYALGVLLKNKGKTEQTMIYLRKAAMKGHTGALNILGLHYADDLW